jgi:P-type E1-E2 ATPase
LIGSSVITALLGHFFYTAVILTVVIANAVIGFIQEGKAENALASIRHMLAPKANVLRNGSRSYIPAELLVTGDLVYLEPGDKVPADCG